MGRNAGFAAGNNAGVAAADCDWIALLNPDAFPEPEWLERLLASAEAHPEFSFFGSLLLAADAPDTVDGTATPTTSAVWRGARQRPSAGRGPPRGEIFSPCARRALPA